MTVKQFVENLEAKIVLFAKENTEGSYYQAKHLVKSTFEAAKLPLTDRQVIKFVNRVWDKTHVEVAR